MRTGQMGSVRPDLAKRGLEEEEPDVREQRDVLSIVVGTATSSEGTVPRRSIEVVRSRVSEFLAWPQLSILLAETVSAEG